MSSPVPDEADKQPEQSDQQHEAETYRLQSDVIQAAQRLEIEAAQQLGREAERALHTPFQLNNNTVTFRIPVARRPIERPSQSQSQSQDDTNERVWSALRSEFLAPPQQKGWGIPGAAMIAGTIGAVIVSAATALLVVNMLNLSATASRDDETARNQSFSAAAANLSMVATAQAKMQPSDEQPAPNGSLLAAAVPAEDIAATKSPARLPASSPSPELKPAAIESPPSLPEVSSPPAAASAPPTAASAPLAVASLPPAAASAPPALMSAPPAAPPAPPAAVSAPPASAPPATASAPPTAAPEPQPTIALSPDEIAALLKRGRDLIAAGDVASARLVLTHLADSGVAEASFVLASTFDPAVLETLRVVGMKPDPAKARAWYSRAADQGSLEAKQRLQALR